MFCPKAGLSLKTQHSPHYLLLSLPFRICIQSIYHDVRLSSDIFFCFEPSSHLPFLLEHPSAGSSFLTSGPVNFFSSSLSVPALFFLHPLFLAQLHFLFCLSILRAPSFSISTSQTLLVVFAHSVEVSKSLHNATLHTKHFTSFVLILFPRALRICFCSC